MSDDGAKPDGRRFWPEGTLDRGKIRNWVIASVAVVIAVAFIGTAHSPKPQQQPTVNSSATADVPPPPSQIQAVSAELDGQAKQFAEQQKSLQDQADSLNKRAAEYQDRINRLNAQNVGVPPMPEAQQDNAGRPYVQIKKVSVVSPVIQDLRLPIPPPAVNDTPSGEANWQDPRIAGQGQAQLAQSQREYRDWLKRSQSQPQTDVAQQKHAEQPTDKNKDLLLPDPSWPTVVIPEGTVFEAVLENKLEGSSNGEVKCMLTTAVYSNHTLLLPQGTEILGESATVNLFGQDRLGLAFHRALVHTPSGDAYGVSFDTTVPGLDQEGASGVKDKVNNHWMSTFLVSGVVGAIAGLSQVGNGSVGLGYDPMIEFRSGITQTMSQQSMQIMNRFLNRNPKLTIRPGTRVKLMLVSDLMVPVYRGE